MIWCSRAERRNREHLPISERLQARNRRLLSAALMYPILFRIYGFPVNTYGVFLALAFLGAIFVTVKLAVRDGLPRERIYDLCLWLLLSSLVGSKLLMFLTEPEYY